MIDIEVALKWYLLDSLNDGATTDPVRITARTNLQDMVGRGVFFGRLPEWHRRAQEESERAVTMLALLTDIVTVDRSYQQFGQLADVHTFLSVEVRSRKGPAPRAAKQLLTELRLCVTSFCGVWKYLDDRDDPESEIETGIHFVKFVTESSASSAVGDGTDRWLVNRRCTLDIHHWEDIPTSPILTP